MPARWRPGKRLVAFPKRLWRRLGGIALFPDGLCDKCRVLEFDDSLGHAGRDQSDMPFFAFDGEDGEDGDDDDAGSNDRSIRLDYYRVDTSPKLPVLRESGRRGCRFCALLRQEIMDCVDKHGYGYHGGVSIELMYHWWPARYPGAKRVVALTVKLKIHLEEGAEEPEFEFPM